jgi:phospholipid/cholesterol/gamma-HCH transport system permease protein
MSEWVRARVKNVYLRGLLIGLWDIFYIARLGLSFENIGSNLLRFFQTVGGVSWLLLRSLLALLLPPYRFREMFKQMEMAGWRSILLVGAVLGFLGLITVLELNFQLSRVVGSTTFVPGFAGILIFREFGSTVVAAMFAAKVGAGWAAEISNMKISEQIDAMEMSSVNPVNYIVVPRLVASATMLIALSVMGTAAAVLLGWFVSRQDFSFWSYYTMLGKFTKLTDLGTLFTKAMVFSPVVPICSAWYGFRAQGGARGVGEATTKSVVTSILIIILLDFFMNAAADKILRIVLE